MKVAFFTLDEVLALHADRHRNNFGHLPMFVGVDKVHSAIWRPFPPTPLSPC